jgi:hypothetical protein
MLHPIMLYRGIVNHYSYHLQYEYPNLPMSESLVLAPNGDRVSPYFGEPFLDEPLPYNGHIKLDAYSPVSSVAICFST